MISNGRLESAGNTQKQIITAFEKFKRDNNRTNTSYKVYLQGVPLFVKEFLEQNYELKFKIVNPNIPAAFKASVNPVELKMNILSTVGFKYFLRAQNPT